jgi:hypothetical protein
MRKTCDPLVPLTLICRNYSTKTYRVLTCLRLRCDSLQETLEDPGVGEGNPAC